MFEIIKILLQNMYIQFAASCSKYDFLLDHKTLEAGESLGTGSFFSSVSSP